MERSLAVKTNAVQLLEKQLHAKAKKQQYGIIKQTDSFHRESICKKIRTSFTMLN